MGSVRLDRRGVLGISGPEARLFLDRIVTCDVDPVAPGRAAFGALLSPQGKILGDFILFAGPDDDSFLLDAPAAVVADLAKRLTLYRLRAKIAITDRSADHAVVAGWDGGPPADALAAAPDPRLPELGWRAIVPAPTDTASDAAPYDARRVLLGVPEGGLDYAFADAFPHEADMDQLNGVAFDKGCYVGQEVVSRMQHRGTARTRVVPVRFDGAAPVPGTEVTAGDRVLGRTGTAAGAKGLATLRLDRAADALGEGAPITAGGVPIAIETRDWIGFPVPGHAEKTA